MNASDYCRVLVKSILELDEVPFDIYVKLSDQKILHYSRKDGALVQLKNCLNRGIDYVWVKKKDYERFKMHLNSKLARKFFKYNGDTLKNGLLDSVDHELEIVGEKFRQLGISSQVVDSAKKITKDALTRLSKVPGLYDLVASIEEISPTTYQRNLMTGITTTTMLDGFTWHSRAIKEKLVFVALISKAGLGEKDLQFLQAWEELEVEARQLPVHIKKVHEQLIKNVQIKMNNNFANEVITILSQSNELPTPEGGYSSHLILLTCIYIVARSFVAFMDKSGFEKETCQNVLLDLKQRFSRGHFKKAFEALEGSF